MSREQSTNEDRTETTTGSGEVNHQRSSGGPQGGAAVGRIDASETFWTHLAQLTPTHNAHAIEQLLFDTNEQGQLDRMVRYGSRPQMSTLLHALRTMSPGGHPRQIDDALWTIFAALADAWVGTKRLAFCIRFRISVIGYNLTGDHELDWDAHSLRRLWGILAALPPEHVEGNHKLDHLVRYQNGATVTGSGGYYSSKELAAIQFDPDTIGTTRQTGSSQVNARDPLANVNRFDKVVRHEVGHAVDAELGIGRTYCHTAGGANWHTLSLTDWVVEIMTSGGYNNLFSHAHDAATAFAKHMHALDRNTTVAALHRAFPTLATRPAGELPRIEALLTALQHLMQDDGAGYSPASPVVSGGRAFHRDGGTYYAYDAAARTRQVSNYQFRTPMEWVAEAYAAYYEPDPRGRGAKLAERDPATKHWFDAHVHKHGPSTT